MLWTLSWEVNLFRLDVCLRVVVFLRSDVDLPKTGQFYFCLTLNIRNGVYTSGCRLVLWPKRWDAGEGRTLEEGSFWVLLWSLGKVTLFSGREYHHIVLLDFRPLNCSPVHLSVLFLLPSSNSEVHGLLVQAILGNPRLHTSFRRSCRHEVCLHIWR